MFDAGVRRTSLAMRGAFRVLLSAAAFLSLPLVAAAQNQVSQSGQADRRAAQDYSQREDVLAFVVEMVERHSFQRSELVDLFSRTRFQPSIVKAITPPAEPQAPTWQSYRQLFVNPERIQAGARFLARHSEALVKAEARFGVPQEIIVAIIGVETVYGRNVGRHRVIDALATLAFDYPPRAEYFRSELENFLLMSRETGVDVLSVKGSYAGAIGIPQFMPGSYRRYAVDFDGDGKSDLAGSPTDAIGSVANFLSEHGWARGEAISWAARVPEGLPAKFLQSGIKPSLRLGELTALGLTQNGAPSALAAPAAMPEDSLVTLVGLKSVGPTPDYRVGFNNFYVLTRYNRSSLYASAVLALGEAIRAESQR